VRTFLFSGLDGAYGRKEFSIQLGLQQLSPGAQRHLRPRGVSPDLAAYQEIRHSGTGHSVAGS